MYKSHHFDLLNFWQRTCKYILVFTWIFGLVLGLYAALRSGDSFALMMRGFDLTVSISGLLLMVALPFLLSAFAVYFSQPLLFLLTVLGKAFVFGYCSCGLVTAYGDAFWLMQLLLMFSDFASLPFLMWFWFRCAHGAVKNHIKTWLVLAAVVTALVVVDICIVSPFVTMLL